MGELLEIAGGPIVELGDQPAQGTRHDVFFGVVTGTGERVAVKLGRPLGALTRERAVLAWLGGRGRPVPRLVSGGEAVVRGERVECVVSERRPGSPPTTSDGWRRMGRAYASLAPPRDAPADLPVLDRVTFGRMHGRRVRALGDLMAPYVPSIPDWDALCSERVPGSPPLVVTHGDPGPGNFLDDGRGGAIIDWEEAHIAPRGLDLARLSFIALLGAGPRGYVARDHEERARAVVDGYLDVLRADWQPCTVQWRWWITVAGVQFIHHRWRLGGHPGPWEDAAEVLAAALWRDGGI